MVGDEYCAGADNNFKLTLDRDRNERAGHGKVQNDIHEFPGVLCHVGGHLAHWGC